MLEQARQRTLTFQRRLKEEGVEIAVLTDQSSIAYLAGFWGYLSVEFGRPTFLIVRPDGEPVVVTPLMESEMVSAMTWVSRASDPLNGLRTPPRSARPSPVAAATAGIPSTRIRAVSRA